ncbi:CRISPR-associated endonuclease Cas4/Cas1 [Zavarzinella formosa]|uniref:CRISPR-associated endonuclease Cas4/Cas1 n=1 Tax=Zavarzinella formosa TaxID=360055 RepID=UPI000592EB33|nr:CRISPR-associated endonuclease Cas4/Cas1 [Zavarzinella formosa]
MASAITIPLDLIPARALNQVTFCPRLYFLQYVDAVVPVNEHVEGGLFDHRRTDDPGLANKTRKDGDVYRTRSVTVSSERLGVTAKLDVLEERDGEPCPVETKHGNFPRDQNGEPYVYDNDAVQLCIQGMLLEEELGRPVSHGIQFSVGSRDRLTVPFTEELRTQTLAAIDQIREIAARDTPPPPLPSELRNRCHGCSLCPICLPEETLFGIAEPETPPSEGTPTLPRVIPHSDAGAVLYVQEPGAYVGKRGEHLIISKDGQELNKAPIHAVRQVVIFGNVQVSTQALATLATNEIPVSYLSGYGKYIATLVSAPAKNVSLREAQFRKFDNPDIRISLAREVVRAKLTNQRVFLMRCLRAQSEEEGRVTAKDEPAARGISDLLNRLDRATELESLLGLEGQGAALYFGEFGRFLRMDLPDGRFDFTTRNRRPPRDPVNALLSFAYAMLAKDAFSAVCTVGFDPYRGFYHVGRHGKPSLALDIMEEFRTIIADSVVVTLINNRLLTPGDFIRWKDACQLTDAGRKKFFAAYEQRKAAEVTHPQYGYRMSYSRMLEVQARMLAAYVRGDVPRYHGFIVR